MKISRWARLGAALLFGIFLVMKSSSQPPVKNYEAAWKKADDFINKGLPESALAEVKKIYTLARKENQPAQVIKCLVYMGGLQEENREDNEEKAISELEAELPGSRQPVTSLLQSLLAGKYLSYLQNNRWKLYNRTQTRNFDKKDIATWDAEDFHRRIGELYLASVKEEKMLQQTRLEPYQALIRRGTEGQLRPTMYDLLVHRALDYFEDDERDIARPAYAFEIDQAGAFDPAAGFVRLRLSTRDSSSLHFKALELYQRLLLFHLGDKDPAALLDADFRRLAFVKDKSTHPDKEQLSYKAWQQLANQYGSHPAAAQAWYLLADWHRQQAATWKPHGDSAGRFDYLKAKELAEKVLQQKEKSEGRVNCENLLRDISRRQLNFHLEKVNLPEQPFRVLAEYRNIRQLHLRLIAHTAKLEEVLRKGEESKNWAALLAAPSLRDWQQSLPETNDMQPHRVEIKTDGLPPGAYILLAGDGADFKNGQTLLGARLFYVSNISFLKSARQLMVLHRQGGQPLNGSSVQVWEEKYDYKSSRYIREKKKLYKADANGAVTLDKEPAAGNNYTRAAELFEFTWNGDRLFIDEAITDYYYRDPENKETAEKQRVFLFTDRAIYRPGQTVYFKGLVLTDKGTGRDHRAAPKFNARVILRDANYQEIGQVELLTNEYGSFQGRFQLPSSGVTGQFSISVAEPSSQVSFRVEEYKRPKFYVEYEPLKGTYRVNDTIHITGSAKAYAGNRVDGAKVSYRVVRQPRYIYPWLFWRGWQPPVEEMEIAHGETTTDAQGLFKISFTAIPDRKTDPKLDPVFDYTVYADVTDINGETRSGEKTVSVSYKSLLLTASIPEKMVADSLRSFSIRTQNLNGEFEPATVQVRLYRVKTENRLIRKRYWDRPDQFVMNREEYVRHFPFDEYDNESDPQSWEKGALVWEQSDSTRADGNWVLKQTRYEPGFYLAEISTRDKDGKEVRDQRRIELYNPAQPLAVKPAWLWTEARPSGIPGETATVTLASSAADLFLVQSLVRRENETPVTQTSYDRISTGPKTYSFPLREEDRGGFSTGWAFVKQNRVYQYRQGIVVPWDNKELNIEYASFRDKTLPGSQEKWKVRIAGLKGEKTAAEMLATLYDASLDQFAPHSWSTPSVWPYFYGGRDWDSRYNFEQVSSNRRYLPEPEAPSFYKTYDELFVNLFGYESYGNRRLMYMMREAAPAMESMAVADSAVAKSVEEKPAPAPPDADADGVADKADKTSGKTEQDESVQIRRNFNETAFFLPELRTDSSGAIEFSFTMPEALTRWKFMALAHTKEAAFGYSTREMVTQKELMVQPNPPRFLREGDRMEFSAKLVNLSEREVTGTATLELFDASTGQPVDGWLSNRAPVQYFTAAAGQSTAVAFPLEVPYQFNRALTWRIIARVPAQGDAVALSDGEENSLPVLTNRMLVTESMPLALRGTGSRDFVFKKLTESVSVSENSSASLQHQSLTVEYTSNPAWYAVQALPYLMEYPYECAEQTWNRYYANSLATAITGASPRIKAIFEQWKNADTAALLSNLQKNEALKSVLLEETPWVLQAQSESQRKKNIALLFDLVRMSGELDKALSKLREMQSPNGGFVWFTGGPDDRYMTQYIVTGIGHLMKLKSVAPEQENPLREILELAIPYLDQKMTEDYNRLRKQKVNLARYTPGYIDIQYLYMRSFFPQFAVKAAHQTAYRYYLGRVARTWTTQSKYMQAMISLALHRNRNTVTAAAILKSLRESAVKDPELGMYYRQQRRGWFWYEAPIESQALIIEAFQEAGRDTRTVDDLKTWLLKNKQTSDWETTRATAEACYALLLQGSDWLTQEPEVQIDLGSNIRIRSADEKTEAGTGYLSKTFEGLKVKPEMGRVRVTVTLAPGQPATTLPTWGAVYWQYFEDLDKITPAATPLQLSKKLFVETNTDRGPVLTPVQNGDALKVGDKIKVRIELRADRDMEYMHLKDMRAAALEPVNVLSQYRWQGGLGYYESTRDAGTHFFISYLPRGTWVFEYSLFVTHTGNFSNGITSIQCLYAPEFSAHSEGIRFQVE